jgi:hypothetical protein
VATKHPAIKTRFQLDNASGTLTDISTWLTSVQGSSDTDFLDATTFQPDVVGSALKDEIPGFASKGYSLSGMWSEAVEAFFSAIEGDQNLEYEYRPDDPNMNSSITGLCSCGSYSGPQSEVNGLVTFTAELRVQTRSFNQGSAGSPN